MTMQAQFNLETHKKRFVNWFEAIIFPDGRIEYANPSHVGKMIAFTNESQEAIYEKMPIDAAPLWWLVEYTGCIAVWLDGYIGCAITDRQKESFEMLIREGLVKDRLFR